MNFISCNDLMNFVGKFPDTEEEGTFNPQEYCDAAMESIKDYIGYDPELQTYTEVIKGDGGKLLGLPVKHIINITGFSINGVECSPEEIEITEKDGQYVNFVNGNNFEKGARYSVTFSAGYSTVPSIIRTTALQIGSVIWESAGGNIAVNSTSFADTGSRVFTNYKIDRFLEQISQFKRNM